MAKPLPPPSAQPPGMPYQELILLIPSHGLEDFPLHATSDEAAGLLAGWSALWHPALIAASGATPTWRAAFAPPDMSEGRLLVVPEMSQASLPEGYLERAAEAGATVIAGEQERETIIAAALAGLELPGELKQQPDTELVADCLALGFCFLQVELLTRHMRFASNLDENRFRKLTLELATAIMQGSEELARERLTTCFDMLSQERDHYYPVDVYLLDLTIVAPTTIGEDLRQELSHDTAQSLLASAATIEAMAANEPASLAAVKTALGETVTLVGGEYEEGRLPLLGSDAILQRLRQGHATYEKHLGCLPVIYGRRRYGLTPLLPNVLENLNYKGVFHATLDDGRFPRGSQAKVRWEGLDGWAIDTLARVPLDAALPETWLSLAKKLAEAMDLDHIATLILAHWPARTTPWHEDLRRVTRYSGVLGKFVSLETYFTKTEYAGQLDRFRPDAYVSPYLRQDLAAGSPQPLTATVAYDQHRGAAESAHTLSTFSQLLGGAAAGNTNELLSEVEAAFDANRTGEPLAQKLTEANRQAAAALAARVNPPAAAKGSEEGVLVFNPCSFTRKVGLELPTMNTPPAAAGPVLASTRSGKQTFAVVELPPLGYAWVSPGGKATARRRRGSSEPVAAKTAEGYVLRNEYFEAHIHPGTGGLKAVYDYKTRGNRLSQLLGLRESAHAGGEESNPYGDMQAEKVSVEYGNELTGRIVTQGRLLTVGGKAAGRFEQSFTLWRGSRVLEIEIELKPSVELGNDPWEDYFACRLAWPDVSAHLFRNIGGVRQQTENRRIESPLYVQIDDASTLTTVLSGGLPYHRRSGQRMLDTLLLVKGETARRFKLGIAFDTPYVLSAAMERVMPPVIVPAQAGPPTNGESGWLMSLDTKNVVATHWEPLAGGAGFRVCLQESMGRAGQTRLSSFRPLAEARLLDGLGNERASCPIEDGAALIELPAGGWVEVEGRWA